MKYYTIFLGNKLWTNCIDDMNTTESWAMGGMLWTNKRKALACIKHLKEYDFETDKNLFTIKEFKVV